MPYDMDKLQAQSDSHALYNPQNDENVIASNKEVNVNINGKEITKAASESIAKQTAKSYSGSNNKSLITAVVDDKSMTVVISTNVGKRIYQLFRD